MAEHKDNISHDIVNEFLRKNNFNSSDLWSLVRPYIEDSQNSFIIADDSVQDKRYSNFG